MKLRELFFRDIFRNVKPAVVVGDMDGERINQEIEEYVITTSIAKSINDFFKAIFKKQNENTGIWIKGYYGSGKSHFIKYLFYLVDNKFSEKALAHLSDEVKEYKNLPEVTPADIQEIKKSVEKFTIDKIIFNIDYEGTEKYKEDSITEVFINQFNLFRGYNDTNIDFALLVEKHLDEIGKFDEFKKIIETKYGNSWEKDYYNYIYKALDKVLEVAKSLDAELDIESIKAKILNTSKQSFNIHFLISQLKNFLDSKPENYRLLFLVDEISQYIGSNTNLLLNLQTIIEYLAIHCKEKIWIAVTAQEDLSNLITKTDDKNKDDFGKILGRFETRISLQSTEVDYITKRRILDKKSEGIGQLTDFFRSNKVAIENMFHFDHDLYKNYDSEKDFCLTYPLIPYQFRLITEVLQSFSQLGYVGEGIKDSERSVLGISHTTTKNCADNEMGYFIPFDQFFNNSIRNDLTQFARNMIDRAYSLDFVKKDPFALRVVNALFMISNLSNVLQISFPPNASNLTLLLLENLDQSKNEVKSRIEKVLNELVSKNIVQSSTDGTYRFLKEDEIEVATLIKNNTVNLNSKLQYFYYDILEKIIKPNSRIDHKNSTFKISLRIDELNIYSGGDFQITLSVFDGSNPETLAIRTPKNELVVCISEWFTKDLDLHNNFLQYAKTQKYIRDNRDSAAGTREGTLKSFSEANEKLLEDIIRKVKDKFLQTTFISSQQIIKPSDLNSQSPVGRFDEVIKKHIEEIYKKISLAEKYAKSNEELKQKAKEKIKIDVKTLNPAEDEVLNKLMLLGDGTNVDDLVKAFQKDPYGWKDLSTIHVLLELGKKGKKKFKWHNEEIDFITFVDKALNSRERSSITIHDEEDIDKNKVIEFIQVVNNELFPNDRLKTDTSDPKLLISDFKDKLDKRLIALSNYKDNYASYPFVTHFKSFYTLLDELVKERNSLNLIDKVILKKNELKDLRDIFTDTEDFIKNHIDDYKLFDSFTVENHDNFSELDESSAEKGEFLHTYYKENNKPWETFPQIKQAYKELREALSKKVNNLIEEATLLYENAFLSFANKLKVIPSANHLIPDKDYWLVKIKKTKEISKLKLLIKEADDFKTEHLKQLDDFKSENDAKKKGETNYYKSVKISVAKELEPRTVENEEQLDQYLTDLKAALLKYIQNKKKIYLS